MIYGDRSILALLEQGAIIGAEKSQVNPASINIRLGRTFLIMPQKDKVVRLGGTVRYEPYEIRSNEALTIMPGAFVLATTIECVNLNGDLAAFVQGRSSIGRIGLSVQNAGFVDPGFHGHITLELKNESLNPIELLYGYPVAQLVFFGTTPVDKPYDGKYNGQVEATGSRMYLDGFGKDE